MSKKVETPAMSIEEWAATVDIDRAVNMAGREAWNSNRLRYVFDITGGPTPFVAQSWACWGQLAHHGQIYWDSKNFRGLIISIPQLPKEALENFNLWNDILLGPHSPWGVIAKEVRCMRDGDGYPRAYLVSAAAFRMFPAELVINFMIGLRTPFYLHGSDVWARWRRLINEFKAEPIVAMFLASQLEFNSGRDGGVFCMMTGYDYFLNGGLIDPRKFLQAQPTLKKQTVLSGTNSGIPNNLIWDAPSGNETPTPFKFNAQSTSGLVLLSTEPKPRAITIKKNLFGKATSSPSSISPLKIIPLMIQRAEDIRAGKSPTELTQYNQAGEQE